MFREVRKPSAAPSVVMLKAVKSPPKLLVSAKLKAIDLVPAVVSVQVMSVVFDDGAIMSPLASNVIVNGLPAVTVPSGDVEVTCQVFYAACRVMARLICLLTPF